MSTLPAPRLRIPRTARPGEVIEIRLLMEHRMETGLRHAGAPAAARDMLERLVIRRDGETILVAEFRNGTSANPYHILFVRMDRTATFTVTYTDDKGRSATAAAQVSVS
jgi:sulfur-oxidizing protein SoxZ